MQAVRAAGGLHTATVVATVASGTSRVYISAETLPWWKQRGPSWTGEVVKTAYITRPTKESLAQPATPGHRRQQFQVLSVQVFLSLSQSVGIY